MFRSKSKPFDSITSDNTGSENVRQRRNANAHYNTHFQINQQTSEPQGRIKRLFAKGNRETIVKDRMVYFLYALNIIILVITIVTYVMYERKMPDNFQELKQYVANGEATNQTTIDFKTPLWMTILTGVLYGLSGITTLLQMKQVIGRVTPSPN